MADKDKEQRFVALIKEHERLILKVCAMYSRCNWGEAQDLYQEAVCALWRSFDSFRGESKCSTWIYAVTRYTMVNLTRRHQTDIRTASLEEVDANTISEADDQMLDELREALDQLEPEERDMFVMWMEGFKNEEIAQVMGLKAGTVAVRLTRLKMRLRRMINRETKGGMR